MLAQRWEAIPLIGPPVEMLYSYLHTRSRTHTYHQRVVWDHLLDHCSAVIAEHNGPFKDIEVDSF